MGPLNQALAPVIFDSRFFLQEFLILGKLIMNLRVPMSTINE